MSAEAVAAYFDERAARWDEEGDSFGAKHRAVAVMAGVRAGSRVLDIGCGTGIMVQAYLDCGAASVEGIDMSSGMVACAREKFAANPAVSFACGDVAAYRAEEPFDVAVIYNAYPHMLDKQAVVSAVADVLGPGGRFLVAHGASREAINAHHGNVPAEVTHGLLSAEESAEPWRRRFDIDIIVDAPHLYAFGGVLRAS